MIDTSKYTKTLNSGNAHEKAVVIRQLEQLSRDGDYEASYILSQCYMHGNGVPQDDGKAFELICQAYAVSSDPSILSLMGRMRLEGIGCQSDEHTGITYLKEAYEKGDINAPEYLANYYFKLDNEPTAFTWLQRGSELGNDSCTHRLAVFFATSGSDSDKRTALALFKKLLHMPKPVAYVLEEDGMGVASDEDYEMFYRQAERMAASGDLDWNVAYAYGKLNGTRFGNKEEGLQLMAKLAKAGSPEAAIEMASQYYGLSEYDKSEEYAHLALDNGARPTLPHFYIREAILHKLQAGSYKTPEARHAAQAYVYHLLEQDYWDYPSMLTASTATNIAFDSGNRKLLERARNIIFDAIERYEEDDCARELADRLSEAYMTPSNPLYEPQAAMPILQKCKELNTVGAETGAIDYYMGVLYEYGWGVPMRLDEAVECYLKGSQKNNAQAMAALGTFKKGIFGWKKVK